MTEPTDTKRFQIARFVVLSGWIVTIVISGIILASSTWMSVISGQDPPEFLKSQSNIALGFLVGSFVGLVKDFIGVDRD